MLDNVVNRHDVGRVYRKLSTGRGGDLLDKLRGSRSQRVIRHWDSTPPVSSQWWVIPAVRSRWNRLISGHEQIDFPAFATDRYLRGASGLHALSLGCGSGGRELRWAELGAFERIDAFDISPSQVALAADTARERGLDDIANFQVRDFTTLDEHEMYDVVLAEHSLHHLAPMPEMVAKVERLLKPGGMFMVDEFVGPRRFQWTDPQVEAAQAILDRFPERYRRMGDGRIKDVMFRPSKLWMWLTDPSEAIDSARITSSLHDRFDVLEELPYGGSVLHLALADISHNFIQEDPETESLLNEAFEHEDALMAEGLVQSDFVAFVCRKVS